MAVVTGTPWDLALDQSAGGDRTEAISARSAYQDSLYERAILVDIRPNLVRRRDGELPAHLDAAVVEARELITWLVEHSGRRVILVSDDGVEAAGIASALSEVRLASPGHLTGGFGAWLAAGLPTRAYQQRSIQ